MVTMFWVKGLEVDSVGALVSQYFGFRVWV